MTDRRKLGSGWEGPGFFFSLPLFLPFFLFKRGLGPPLRREFGGGDVGMKKRFT